MVKTKAIWKDFNNSNFKAFDPLQKKIKRFSSPDKIRCLWRRRAWDGKSANFEFGPEDCCSSAGGGAIGKAMTAFSNHFGKPSTTLFLFYIFLSTSTTPFVFFFFLFIQLLFVPLEKTIARFFSFFERLKSWSTRDIFPLFPLWKTIGAAQFPSPPFTFINFSPTVVKKQNAYFSPPNPLDQNWQYWPKLKILAKWNCISQAKILTKTENIG